ncbi:MAG: EFR1 family ferrodoxin [Candidatus Thorarchaeota archaeon]
MDTTIYFFTGTGNSLKIAKDIAKELLNSELIPIAKIWKLNNLEVKSKKVGFIFPLYYSGLPKIVYDFISKLNFSNVNYFFAVITSAGDINELPLQQIEKILIARKKTLNAGFYITMPNNYIIGYDIDSQKKQQELFEKATNQVHDICEIVKNEENNLNQEFFLRDVKRSARFNKDFRDNVMGSDKSFYADEKCTSCGICEIVCPVRNIVLLDGIPQWNHKCQQCLACINFCPEESIQFGTGTLKTRRYHHPEISLQEISKQRNSSI